MTQNDYNLREVTIISEILKGDLLKQIREEVALEKAEEDKLLNENSFKDKDSYFKLLDSKNDIIKREEETNMLLTQKLKNLLEKVEKKSNFSSSYIIKLNKEDLEDIQRLIL